MTSPAGTTAAELDRTLTFGDHSYPFTVCSGPGAWDDLARRTAGLRADRFIVVADTGVPPQVRGHVLDCLPESAGLTVCDTVPGEENKSFEAVAAVMAAAARDHVTRRSVVVALGGGQAGNIAGLAAALMFRGAVRLLHIPTTLLALSDSVVSRKQAVNLGGAKNTAGAFKTPDAVWADLGILKSLPPDAVRAALCEGIKNLVAILPGRVPAFASVFRPGADYTDGELIQFIAMCLDAKQSVMRDDPEEKGHALVLEYGHTAGHVIELVCKIPHGLAIGIGGLVAARTAAVIGLPGAGRVLEMHQELLRQAGAPTAVPRGVPDATWTSMLLRDNKRGYRPIGARDLEMVLLAEPGMPHYTGGLPLTQVPVGAVLQAIRASEQAA